VVRVNQDRKVHWEGVYEARQFTDVSWYQELPEKSLRQIEASGVERHRAIIDVGGGASTLVDHLIERGYVDLTVVDISANGLAQSRARLAEAADKVTWIVSDVTAFRPERSYSLWHDRAVLHFLTDPADRQRYVDVMRAALPPGGYLVLATFGPDGPLKCSGLEVRRYSVDTMSELLGPDFELQHHDLEVHETPSGASQQFLFTRWRRTGA
jgi:SAM-dependent methyltransferase